MRTLKMMGNYGMTFATIGGVYIGIEKLLHNYRMKRDFINGAVGGFVGGACVLGYKAAMMSLEAHSNPAAVDRPTFNIYRGNWSAHRGPAKLSRFQVFAYFCLNSDFVELKCYIVITSSMNENVEEMDIEVLSSMWPEDINEAGKQFNVERPGADQDMLEEVTIIEETTIVDFKRLSELTNYSEKGSSQLAYLVKNWEYKQANAVRLLKEELDYLSKQKHEFELKQLEILEEHPVPRTRNDVVVQNKGEEIDAEYNTVIYWKQRAMHLEKLLEASIQREQTLMDRLEESIKNLERQSSPVEELSQILKRADNFLHFILQTAPVVIGHQDNELKYRFIYNHFPSLQEEDIIGRTDVEIFTGAGVKESQDFKREVLERGLPAKREITFETELFGSKTFLIYVEPVFSKAGDTIGVNYMGMDVTDQVRKREKMAKLREEIAVQKAKETELSKTIHITEETMRAKQMLATMSHEIRSPLSGVVSMAEILSTTNLDKEQRQLLKVMLSSGDLVLQLINDILDLSKVESGVMKLEAAKFRPREVVRHVLQTAAASLQKILILEGHVEDGVPVERCTSKLGNGGATHVDTDSKTEGYIVANIGRALYNMPYKGFKMWLSQILEVAIDYPFSVT
ncbi:hypothetical protein TEA_024068 [Camellia sinensis var. sinensis]|uniref:histidine kinase n=1 Tax=Camellia sinensis var. sinensis TaxID=542762 RepID=A0A4S4EBP5_CAMSN|nr:hypothetical protein TEA_024068 [Camellia sinensis var. sinensis]